MANANYFITGVWFDSSGKTKSISHVLLHKANEDGSWEHGAKTLEADVINLIDQKKIVQVKTWNYKKADWETRAVVTTETVAGKKVLRTKADDLITDNLDNLIRMVAIA